jgi:putative oxidoreductase
MTNPITTLIKGFVAIFDRIPESVVLLGARIGLAGVFWTSARTKVEGYLTLTESTFALFREEYKLPLLPPDLAAYLGTYAEHALPLLLVLGLATRFAALGLFMMTLVIQVFVYPAAFLNVHAGWFALALLLIARGGGKFSLDWLLFRKS